MAGKIRFKKDESTVTGRTLGRSGMTHIDPLTFIAQDASAFAKTIYNKPVNIQFLTRKDFAGATDGKTIYLDGNIASDDSLELTHRGDLSKGILLDELGHMLWTKYTPSQVKSMYFSRRNTDLPFTPNLAFAMANLVEDHYNVRRLLRKYPGFSQTHYTTVQHYINAAERIEKYRQDIAEQGIPTLESASALLILMVKGDFRLPGADGLNDLADEFERVHKLHRHEDRIDLAIELAERFVETYMTQPKSTVADEPEPEPEPEPEQDTMVDPGISDESDESDEANDSYTEPGPADSSEDFGGEDEAEDFDDEDSLEDEAADGAADETESEDEDGELGDGNSDGDDGDSDDDSSGDADSSGGQSDGASESEDEGEDGEAESVDGSDSDASDEDSYMDADTDGDDSSAVESGEPEDSDEAADPTRTKGSGSDGNFNEPTKSDVEDQDYDLDEVIQNAGMDKVQPMDGDDPTRQGDTTEKVRIERETIMGNHVRTTFNPDPVNSKGNSMPKWDRQVANQMAKRLKLTGQDEGGWTHGYRSGKILPRDVVKVAMGSRTPASRYNSQEAVNLSVTILQDGSSSISDSDHALINRFCDILIAAMDNANHGLKVWHMVFQGGSGNPSLIVTKEPNKQRKVSSRQASNPWGSTPTLEGMAKATQLMNNADPTARKMIILLTDGAPNHVRDASGNYVDGNVAIHSWIQENRDVEILQVLVNAYQGADVRHTIKVNNLDDSTIARLVAVINATIKDTRSQRRLI